MPEPVDALASGLSLTCVDPSGGFHSTSAMGPPTSLPSPEPERTKHCHACDTTKSRGDFFTNTARRDGLSTYCRTCGSNPAKKARARAILPAEPIIARLRHAALVLAFHEGDSDFGIRRLAAQMAATFGGETEVYRVQIDRLLRGELEAIHQDSADRLALAVGSHPAELWRGAW